MANWATTDYVIEGDKEDLIKLENILEEADTDTVWEFDIVKALGAEKEDECYRGYVYGYTNIEDMDFGRANMSISADEAWSVTDFRHALQRAMPSLTVYYRTEEVGCDVFETNDEDGIYFKERYMLDYCVKNNIFTEYYTEEGEVLDALSRNLGREIWTLEEMEDINDSLQDNEFIYVHEFEVVSE